MRDISVATFNEMLEQAEDPVRLIDRYLDDRREQIRESERLLRQCAAHAESLKQQVVSAESMKQKREQQALLAVKAGEEDMARLVLQEKLLHEEKAQQYQELYDRSRDQLIELEAQLTQLKAEYQEVADKRSYYMARLESIRLQQRMNAHMSGMRPGLDGRTFYRLDERVSDLEMEAKALRDVRQMSREAIGRIGGTVRQAVEEELALLRNKLNKEEWRP
jgi:phage shock protein A